MPCQESFSSPGFTSASTARCLRLSMIESAVGLSPERASAIASCPCESRGSSFSHDFLATSKPQRIASAASPSGGVSLVKKLRA